ncbi:hypothetical protein EXIGLDRAFT_732940 [Exidia glandulosa HHB12029]|uniref:Extracellular metalloproteinase n=1 Tax=Exidia glandulosa HHB12029 TaxID=1314781 RepID=A0A165PUT0_EXIGL|nr:hypothetical protein EXIGLDRAFT_732940 [Exidia glandulosa HHB12029]
MFTSLRAFVLCVAALSSSTLAAPWPTHVQHSTHRTRSLPNGAKVQLYHPKSSFEIYETGVDNPLSKRSDPVHFTDAGLAFLRSKLGESDDFMSIRSSYAGPHSSHVYVKQRVNGIPVANAVANVALNSKGDVVSFASNFIKVSGFAAPSTKAKITADAAIDHAAKALGGRHTGRAPELEFLATEDGTLALTHAVRLEIDGSKHMVEAYIDARTGEVRGLVDFTNDLHMRVVPVTKSDPTVAYELLKDPEDKKASPRGWGAAEDRDWHATVGNNAIAFKGNVTTFSIEQIIETAAKESAPGVFDYKFDLASDPSSTNNLNAARVNAWYVANMAHDILYRYGFTEEAFNFQNNNFGKGGNETDVVFISVQDASDNNNANFATLPDGEPGIMRMYLWSDFQPMRDGDMSNQIILHEYTHGMTNRMTGGGTAVCLQTTEAQGLGEGWSDAFAEWVAQTANSGYVHDFTIGGYVTGDNTAGIRSHPYSTNRGVNPLTYANVKDSEEVHNIGEIWGQALHVVHAALVQTLGGAKDALTNPDAENGHTAFLHLMIDALALQPCNPSFTDARLAWIQADQNRYNGKNKCNLWLAFAYMGLGVGAEDYTNSHKVPEGCPLKYTKPAATA